jgi:hypothetical protein
MSGGMFSFSLSFLGGTVGLDLDLYSHRKASLPSEYEGLAAPSWVSELCCSRIVSYFSDL